MKQNINASEIYLDTDSTTYTDLHQVDFIYFVSFPSNYLTIVKYIAACAASKATAADKPH